MNLIEFRILGDAVPKQSFVFASRGHSHMKPRAREWQNIVSGTARIFYREDPLEMPLSVEMEFYVQKDRADLDNLCKAVLDGLQGVIFKNDKQVKRLLLTKSVSKIPCVIVRIKEIAYVQRNSVNGVSARTVANQR